MSWAARRRFFILFIIGASFIAFVTLVSIATFYETPSCTDSIQNQDEEGIDCNGSCPYLCASQQQPPTVLFIKALTDSMGRTDVIALVENKNASAAAKNISYRIMLYDATQSLIQEIDGTFDLPPGATVPIYVPGVVPAWGLPQGSSEKRPVAGVFLEIAPSSLQWFSMPIDSRILPTVSNKPEQAGIPSSPRIEAVLENPSATTMTNVRAIILVRNVKGDVIAASSTVIPAIPAQEKATATYTWNSAFSSAPARIDIMPIVPLP